MVTVQSKALPVSLISVVGHRVHDYIMSMWSQQADSGNFEAVVDATALRCKQQLPWWRGVAMHVGRSTVGGPGSNIALDMGRRRRQ